MSRSYWWVNQGKTYDEERRAGILWAPRRAPNGQTKNFWTRMTYVEEDDLILHYSTGALRAVSRAAGPAADSPIPDSLPADEWERDGWLIRARYVDLLRPVRLEEIPLVWREGTKEEPFDKNGNVKQGYLYPLSGTFIEEIRDRFDTRLPKGVA